TVGQGQGAENAYRATAIRRGCIPRHSAVNQRQGAVTSVYAAAGNGGGACHGTALVPPLPLGGFESAAAKGGVAWDRTPLQPYLPPVVYQPAAAVERIWQEP